MLMNGNGSKSVLSDLCSKGASLELTDTNGHAVLQAVCGSRAENEYIVSMLLPLGAKSTVGKTWSVSPFGIATLHRHCEIMSTILRHSGYDALDPNVFTYALFVWPERREKPRVN